jgi:hypothetical protein
MHAPLQSNITLVAELFIAVVIFSIIYRAYFGNVFMKKLALFAIVYETIFNIGYMVLRSVTKAQYVFSPSMKVVGALHGILSLVILIAVIILFVKASRADKRGENYFKMHPVVTILFSLGWIVSLLSGVWLYWAAYIK